MAIPWHPLDGIVFGLGAIISFVTGHRLPGSTARAFRQGFAGGQNGSDIGRAFKMMVPSS